MMAFWLALAAVGSLALGVGALAGWLVMTYPGLGGQQPPPQNASPAGQLVPGVTPGVTGRIVANLVIVAGTGPNTGLFVYNGTPAAGNLPVFAVVAPGVTADPLGNPVSAIVEIGKQSGGHWHWDLNGNLDVNNTSAALIATFRPTDQAFLFYNPGGGTGQLLLSIASVGGTDQFSNTYQQGFEAQTAGGFPYAQLTNGALNFQATSGQFSPGIVESFGVAGEVGITSGLATNTDSASNIIIDSVTASGSGASQISLQTTNVSLDSFATSTIPSANAYPGHQSAAPAAYSQSYEQASTNRINEILDVLTQTGIWHT